jgi:hypothetical protein
MRIAYSCAGEGFGHAARMVALYGELSQNHEVFLYVPGTVRDFVNKKVSSGSGKILNDEDIAPVPHFAFAKKGNAIDYLGTAATGLKTVLGLPATVVALARALRGQRVELVLSDFEPFLPWAARLAGIPIVQMNHPGIVERYVDADPLSWTTALFASLMQGPWDRRILVSFFGGDVGPVLRPSLAAKAVEDRGFLAVNIKEESRTALLPALQALKGIPWRLFPAPGADFDEALATCTAVIAGAGHQTLSEALVLGKPVLAIPQDGQFEQLLNARMLEGTGRGSWCTAKDFGAALPGFLDALPQLRGMIGTRASSKTAPTGYVLRDSRKTLLRTLEQHFNELVPLRGAAAVPAGRTGKSAAAAPLQAAS